jgi:hypothetical protein
MQSSEKNSKRYENQILNERESTHGPFTLTAAISQSIKTALILGNRSRSYIAQESLEMIAGKMARIAAGNWREIDHWRDIAGYAELIVHHLEKPENSATMSNSKEGDLYDRESRN